jgi:hypothetical protein
VFVLNVPAFDFHEGGNAMDLTRVSRGALIAGISGVALFIIMWLPWFGLLGAFGEIAEGFAVPGAAEVDDNINAWQSFDFIDLVLLAAVIVAVGLAVMTAMGSSVNLPVAASALTAGIGVLATLLILYRILDPPFDADREIGVFLGLIAAAGIAVGGWLSMQEEGTTFSGEYDRFGGGPSDPGAPPPPPPPPAGGTGTGAPPPPPPPTSGP